MPNLLVIHLKRFKFTPLKRCKIRTFVDFPINGLNFSDIAIGKVVFYLTIVSLTNLRFIFCY